MFAPRAFARRIASSTLACVLLTGCQLFTHVRDCNDDSECGSGTVCNDTRHFCQIDTVELCDGRNLDDDHDGIPDEREDFGPCRLSPNSGGCRDGMFRCTGTGLVCEPITQASAEICGNGIDDDCNGTIDDTASCMALYPASTVSSPVNIGSNDPSFGEGDDAPEHAVCLAAYQLDRYEVTAGAFARFLNTIARDRITIAMPTPVNPVARAEHYASVTDGATVLTYLRLAPDADERRTLRFSAAHGWTTYRPQDADLPALNVTWYGADAYCRWAGKHLPTEAEWWRAARGRDGHGNYPWGSAPPDCAHAIVPGSDGGCGEVPVTVTSLEPSGNPEGVLHLYGNAQEWMFDWLNETVDRMRNNYYQDTPDGGWCTAYPEGPLGPAAGSPVTAGGDAGLACLRCRFARGRSYGSQDQRLGVRARLDADRGDDLTGFRCSTGGAMR